MKHSRQRWAIIGSSFLLGFCALLGMLLSRVTMPPSFDQGQEVSFVGKVITGPSNPHFGPNTGRMDSYYELTDTQGKVVIFHFIRGTKILDLSGKTVSIYSLDDKWASFTGIINYDARLFPVHDSNLAVPYVDLETVQEIQSAP